MEDKISFLKGVLFLLLIPILVVVFAFVSLYILPSIGIFILPPIAISTIIIYTLMFYILLLYQKVSYSDLDILDRVVIPQAPQEIRDLLIERTRGTNRLVNVEIISSLGKKTLIQSRVVKRIQKRGVNLTSTRIIEYLSKLESLGIIRSQKAYKREYSLTEKGEWCYEAVKKCFPRRQFWFIIRHYLGRRALPTFPETTVE